MVLRYFFIFIIAVMFSSCTEEKNNSEKSLAEKETVVADSVEAAPVKNPFAGSTIDIETFQAEKGWGYNISIDGKKYVHQPHIPAVSGLNGFKTEAQARKTAELVVYKIRNNIMPPSVSKEEMDSLGVL